MVIRIFSLPLFCHFSICRRSIFAGAIYDFCFLFMVHGQIQHNSIWLYPVPLA